jgi:peroxiredoxin
LGKSSWLKKPNDAKDIGFRPPLESLGPFRWSPPSAPKWEVYDSNNELASSESYAGKNYLLIFYLGHGCLHCAEQLGAFGPRVEDFEEAGIEMIAISSDNNAGLSKSLDNYDGEMPIRLASNSSLEIFKSFRAHDDFENQPLHGTFLIDGQGRIRWQDISFEPFMEHEFLLCESKRLLKISGDASTAEDSSDQEAPIRVSKK